MHSTLSHTKQCTKLPHWVCVQCDGQQQMCRTYPCIILTAKGQPDVATRLFLRKLKLHLNLPVLALVDSDPYGLRILSARYHVLPLLWAATM